jgi:endonuclease YncB( thermonuclease family)
MRPRSPGLPREWRPQGRRRRRWSVTAAELRLVLLGGIMLGLVAPQLVSGRLWENRHDDAAPMPSSPESDPWRESRLSREILEAQEAPPASLLPPEPDPQRTAASAGAVRVIDGDTFRLAGETIRIADIDTPEMEGRCAYESALARQAADRIEALLAAGAFELAPAPDGRDEDRYGRKLRIVTRGGESLGQRLVTEGLARTWTGRRMLWCA